MKEQDNAPYFKAAQAARRYIIDHTQEEIAAEIRAVGDIKLLRYALAVGLRPETQELVWVRIALLQQGGL